MTSVEATPRVARQAVKATAFVLVAATLAGCNALTRLSQIGEEPPLTKLESPAVLHENQPISMPMPPPEVIVRQPNSLWRPGSRAFLKDQRASM
ncbi:MAG: flagellar basal body L-ring protein FlgH, partial [Alphaproteobacteria bacterium]